MNEIIIEFDEIDGNWWISDNQINQQQTHILNASLKLYSV